MEILTNLLQFVPNFFHFLFGNKEKKIEQEYLLRKSELKLEDILNLHDVELKKLDIECNELYGRRQVENLTRGEVLNIYEDKRCELRKKQTITEAKVENDVLYFQKMLNKHLGVVGRIRRWYSEKRLEKIFTQKIL